MIRMGNRYYEEAEEMLRDDARGMFQAMSLRQAEIEVIAPKGVVQAADAVVRRANLFWSHARGDGPTASAEHFLLRLTTSENRETAQAAQAAYVELQESDLEADARRLLFRSVPGLSDYQVFWLLRRGRPAELWRRRDEEPGNLNEKLSAFIEAARVMLRSEDDVAPTVPAQRRGWRRLLTRTGPAS
ncbi:hypothetical protein [Streptomyces narbonensis]|uniref:hypothetical protein n=1 Tax=Streptomyces narbonensis TaxID=67333 RepID=UPI0033C9DF2D